MLHPEYEDIEMNGGNGPRAIYALMVFPCKDIDHAYAVSQQFSDEHYIFDTVWRNNDIALIVGTHQNDVRDMVLQICREDLEERDGCGLFTPLRVVKS